MLDNVYTFDTMLCAIPTNPNTMNKKLVSVRIEAITEDGVKHVDTFKSRRDVEDFIARFDSPFDETPAREAKIDLESDATIKAIECQARGLQMLTNMMGFDPIQKLEKILPKKTQE